MDPEMDRLAKEHLLLLAVVVRNAALGDLKVEALVDPSAISYAEEVLHAGDEKSSMDVDDT